MPYTLRRFLYMIPTVLGVILITFVLFNVVGGSPGALALGKNASPQALEEFDEQRGFNKPLVCGWWVRTRACPDTDFGAAAGAWAQLDGAEWVRTGPDGGLLRLPPGTYALPLAFRLRPDTTYAWTARYRLPAGGRAAWRLAGAAAPTGGEWPAAAGWQRGRAEIRMPTAAPTGSVELVVSGGPIELREVSLRRRVRHPLDSQLVFYFRQLARLDFGTSLATQQRVSDMLKAGVGPSLMLTVPIFFTGLVVSVSLALLCAYVRNSLLDRLLVFVAVVLMSVNYLVWIILGQFLLAYRWHWFPVWGFESWSYLVLPAVIGVISGLGTELRFYRTVMLDELYRDYVRTAFAKGASPARVLFRHVLPNAMIPIVTNTVIALPFLYTGSLLLESFFGIPGLGGLSVNAINSADVDVVRGVVLVGATMYVIANLLTDWCYALVDPRVRLR